MVVSGAAKQALVRAEQLLGELVVKAKSVRDDLKEIVGEAPRSMHPFDEADFVLHSALRSAVSAIDSLEKAHADIVIELSRG